MSRLTTLALALTGRIGGRRAPVSWPRRDAVVRRDGVPVVPDAEAIAWLEGVLTEDTAPDVRARAAALSWFLMVWAWPDVARVGELRDRVLDLGWTAGPARPRVGDRWSVTAFRASAVAVALRADAQVRVRGDLTLAVDGRLVHRRPDVGPVRLARIDGDTATIATSSVEVRLRGPRLRCRTDALDLAEPWTLQGDPPRPSASHPDGARLRLRVGPDWSLAPRSAAGPATTTVIEW